MSDVPLRHDRGVFGSDRLRETAAAAERARAELVLAVAEWDAQVEWAADGVFSGAVWLRINTAMSMGEAVTLVREARLVHRLAATRAALASGRLSSGHLRVLAVGVRHREDFYPDSEAALLEAASALSVDEFAVVVRRWRSMADDATGNDDAKRRFERRHLHVSTTLWGTARLDGELDCEGSALVIRALDEYATHDVAGEPSRSPGQRRADALVDMVRAALGHSGHPGEVVHGIDCVIDVATFSRAARAEAAEVEALDRSCIEVISSPGVADLRCDLAGVGPVPPAVVVRLACDAAIGRVLLGGRSEVLDLGRRTRTPSRPQRRALAHRDRHCVFPGCDRPPPWCDAHHLVHWPAGGLTDLDNLVLLCRRHHVLCHEGRWTLVRRDDGSVRAYPPGTPEWVLAA